MNRRPAVYTNTKVYMVHQSIPQAKSYYIIKSPSVDGLIHFGGIEGW